MYDYYESIIDVEPKTGGRFIFDGKEYRYTIDIYDRSDEHIKDRMDEEFVWKLARLFKECSGTDLRVELVLQTKKDASDPFGTNLNVHLRVGPPKMTVVSDIRTYYSPDHPALSEAANKKDTQGVAGQGIGGQNHV